MADLTTKYLGLKLQTPLVASASPLSSTIDGICQLEEAGASAVVLYSLFEEQLRQESAELDQRLTAGTESFAESLTYLPELANLKVGPEEYLKHIRKAKEAVGIPVLGSLNGTSVGGWTKFAKQIEQAGADAIECNIYRIACDSSVPPAEVERDYVEILKAVKSVVKIPVAVKLSPFFTNMAYMSQQLDRAGADGLTLFNRFYQPDINLETLEIEPNVLLSNPQALRLPLTWIGILFGRIKASLAATSGVQGAKDVIKLIMVGADVTEMCSTLMRNGVGHIRTIEQGLREWMDEHEYDSVQQMKGSMSQLKCPNPGAFERAQYMRAIGSMDHVQMTGRQAWKLLATE